MYFLNWNQNEGNFCTNGINLDWCLVVYFCYCSKVWFAWCKIESLKLHDFVHNMKQNYPFISMKHSLELLFFEVTTSQQCYQWFSHEISKVGNTDVE